MSDGALVVLMSMFSIMEATTVVPHHAPSLMISLLPMQAGGWRPTGLLSSSYRSHGRLRRPYAVALEN
eukprot:3247921-Pyramimonas_sp.AAC.1